MEPLFSRLQSTRGAGLPVALHERVAFSPSRTDTSPSDVPELSISGGTVNRVRERERRKQREKSCIEKISGVNPGKEVEGGEAPTLLDLKSSQNCCSLLPRKMKYRLSFRRGRWNRRNILPMRSRFFQDRHGERERPFQLHAIQVGQISYR